MVAFASERCCVQLALHTSMIPLLSGLYGRCLWRPLWQNIHTTTRGRESTASLQSQKLPKGTKQPSHAQLDSLVYFWLCMHAYMCVGQPNQNHKRNRTVICSLLVAWYLLGTFFSCVCSHGRLTCPNVLDTFHNWSGFQSMKAKQKYLHTADQFLLLKRCLLVSMAVCRSPRVAVSKRLGLSLVVFDRLQSDNVAVRTQQLKLWRLYESGLSFPT